MNYSSTKSLEQFVRALHRRHVVLRVLEHVGIGVAWSCAVAGVLVTILLWRGEDGWAVAGATIIVGALAGLIAGMSRRPATIAAAEEADRQLQTADLLATAWAIHHAPAPDVADPWRSTVVALASARCQRLSPSAVLLHRFGLRAWGGIALAVAFVGTMAALSSGSLEAGTERASAVGSAAPPTAVPNSPQRPIVDMNPQGQRRQPRIEQNPAEDPEPGKAFLDNSEMATRDESSNSRPDSRDIARDDGSGTGAGQAKSPLEPRPRESPPITPAASSGQTRAAPSARTAGGTGPAATDPAQADTGAGGMLQESKPPPAPPWEQPSWSTAVEAARREVQSGRVPDDIRDLVRGYFDSSYSHAPERR